MEKFIDRFNKLIDDISNGNVTDFSKKSGIKQPTLHKYTKGRFPNAESLYSLRNNLDVDINWLLTGKGEPYIKKDDEKSPDEFQPPAPNIVEIQHMELVRNFNDKVRAKNADLYLLQIENIDRDTFLEVVGYIKGVASKLKMSADQQIYLGPDRRVCERREEEATDKFSKEADRRGGKDRRKIANSNL